MVEISPREVSYAAQVAQLEEALGTRTVIGQATGILMERFGLDADRAFDVLTRIASNTETKVRDVAADVVRTRRLPQQATSCEDAQPPPAPDAHQ
jgi:AmiR/NasT family two-component response regulator